MIYRLDFNYLYEWNNCNSVNSKLLEMVHNLVPDSLLLYRYKVKKSIINRYGVSDSEKINFDLIKHKSIIVYHLDIYKEKPTLINDLIKFFNIKYLGNTFEFDEKKADSNLRLFQQSFTIIDTFLFL